VTGTEAPSINSATPPSGGARIYRHGIVVRVTHWINAVCLALLLMSGLQIFNAHPRLYWGEYGANYDPAFIEMAAVRDDAGGWRGVTRVGNFTIPTTGVLGLSKVNGEWARRGFPSWLTIPSYQDLASGRRWHFFFAWLFVFNGLVYLAHGVASGHFRRDVLPEREELTRRHLVADIMNHLRFKRATGEAAKHYNTLQKIAYVVAIFVLLPLMLLTGLTMSPGINASIPVLLDVFGGRQSARTLHFISAALIVGFVVIHLIQVVVHGVWNEVRGMITGWYRVAEARDEKV